MKKGLDQTLAWVLAVVAGVVVYGGGTYAFIKIGSKKAAAQAPDAGDDGHASDHHDMAAKHHPNKIKADDPEHHGAESKHGEDSHGDKAHEEKHGSAKADDNHGKGHDKKATGHIEKADHHSEKADAAHGDDHHAEKAPASHDTKAAHSKKAGAGHVEKADAHDKADDKEHGAKADHH